MQLNHYLSDSGFAAVPIHVESRSAHWKIIHHRSREGVFHADGRTRTVSVFTNVLRTADGVASYFHAYFPSNPGAVARVLLP